MADVTLVLKAENSQYVNKVKEAQKASQNLYDTSERGIKREKGLIEDLENAITVLQERKKKAWTIEDIEKYNKKLAEAKRELQEYNDAGAKAEKQTESLSNSIGKWALSLGGAVAILKVLKDAVLATTVGINAFNTAMAVSKQVMYNLVTASGDLTAGLDKVIKAQKELNALRIQDKIDTYNAKIELVKYNQALIQAKDQTKSVEDRIRSYDEAILHKKKSTDIEVKSVEDQIAAYEKILKASPGNEAAMMAYIDLQTKIIDLRYQETSSMKEVSSMRSGLIKKQHDDQIKAWHDEIEENNKKNEAIWKAEDEALKKQGDANKKYYLNARDDFFNFIDEINKKKEEQWKFDSEIGEKLFKQNQKAGKEAWDLMKENEKKQEETEKTLAEMKAESLNRMGTAALDYIVIIDKLAQKEVENAQRKRELFDTQIDEAQSALETEVELYKAGYASNVAAKQKEVNALKAQRDKALKDEEEARKKAHRLQLASLVAQKAVDIATIISSTAAANAKAVLLSPLTFGQPWVAINTISAALGIAAAAAAVAAASTAKYAKGGWTGDGNQRDETGERVAGLVHEKEFVVRKGPAHRFRDVLEAINRDDKADIYNSFVKLSPELIGGKSVSNITVENSGPNNRLDRINSQLYQINKTLQPRRETHESVIEMGGQTIYKKGNTTRTIRR